MPKVTVYTTTTCPYCHAEKDYLKSKGVQFEDVNLDEQPHRIQEFVDTCNSHAVPCTHIVKDDGTALKPIIGLIKPNLIPL